MRRKPTVSGLFYPGDKREILAWMEENFAKTPISLYDAKGIMTPHAGYIYSGEVAAKVYSSIKIPDVAIIMGPNHTGLGKRASIMTEGYWDMPLGSVKIEENLAKDILNSSKVLEDDIYAHLKEHSVEVQVPFLQYLNSEIRIVPIVLSILSFDEILEISEAIVKAVKSFSETILIIASSDMSHYVPSYIAKEKDNLAIDRIISLDGNGLLRTVAENDISMCGYIPTSIMIEATKRLGAKQGKLIAYSNSGEVSGEEPVVGYAGIVLY